VSSTFSGISTALSALYAQRRGLDVTGQNIANVNTEGYSRQRLDLNEVNNTQVPAIFSTSDGIGQGVDVGAVQRLRDSFLEARGRSEHASNSFAGAQKTSLATIEQSFNEPSDTGIQSQMSDVWNAFHDVSLRPGDQAARRALLERSSTLAAGLNDVSSALDEQWSTTREQTKVNVADINNIATEVAKYNESIVLATASGNPTNELQDKRDMAIMKLSEFTGATTRAHDNGAVDVMIGGSPLVYGNKIRPLEATGGLTLASQSSQPVEIHWADTGAKVSLQSGLLAANLETLNRTIPTYTDGIDAVANSLATAVNTQHQAGFDATGAAGGPLFVSTDGTTPVKAATIAVAFTDTTKLAASGQASATGNNDGSNADALAAIGKQITGPVTDYRSLVVDLGVASQSAIRRAAIQDVVTNDVDSARDSEAGVNLDEEMTNLMSYQRAYEAAAKVMATINSVLDTLINNTGVGR
jgi:flagellar hook-associated protein 1 FlgK